MFDTYYTSRHEVTSMPYTRTINEFKAPTDDSIRLYHEMVTKAQHSLLDSFKIKNSLLDVIVNVTVSPFKHGRFGQYKCTINGEDLYGEVVIDNFTNTREEVAKQIVDNIAKHVSRFISTSLLIEDDKYSRFSGGNYK